MSSPGSPPRKRHVITNCCAAFPRPDLLTDTLSVKLADSLHLKPLFCNRDSPGIDPSSCLVGTGLCQDIQKVGVLSLADYFVSVSDNFHSQSVMFGFLLRTTGRTNRPLSPNFTSRCARERPDPIQQRKLSAEITAQADTGLRTFFLAKHQGTPIRGHMLPAFRPDFLGRTDIAIRFLHAVTANTGSRYDM